MTTIPDVTLRELRDAKGLKQMDVAHALGVHVRLVSGWENGTYKPNLRNGIALAKLYGVDVEEISRLTEEGKPSSSQD